MITANCRARFTAADFDFVVRSLSTSPREEVSLVELLADEEARDTILDHERLVQVILEDPSQVPISSHCYFYLMARHMLRRAGIDDRALADYVACLLEAFSRRHGLRPPCGIEDGGRPYIIDLLRALRDANPRQAFLIRAYTGDYTLFITGIFHENVTKRSLKGAPDLSFYEEVGRSNYTALAGHALARDCELAEIYRELGERFGEVRRALNRLADEWLNLDDHTGPLP